MLALFLMSSSVGQVTLSKKGDGPAQLETGETPLDSLKAGYPWLAHEEVGILSKIPKEAKMLFSNQQISTEELLASYGIPMGMSKKALVQYDLEKLRKLQEASKLLGEESFIPESFSGQLEGLLNTPEPDFSKYLETGMLDGLVKNPLALDSLPFAVPQLVPKEYLQGLDSLKIGNLKLLKLKESVRSIDPKFTKVEYKERLGWRRLFGELTMGISPDFDFKNLHLSPTLGYSIDKHVQVGIGLKFQNAIVENYRIQGQSTLALTGMVRYVLGRFYTQAEATYFSPKYSYLKRGEESQEESHGQAFVLFGLGYKLMLGKKTNLIFQIDINPATDSDTPGFSEAVSWKIGLNFR